MRTSRVLGAQDRAPWRWVTLASGPVIRTDASLGFHFRVILTENATLEPPRNATPGQPIFWRVEQDATGGRTLTPHSAIALRGVPSGSLGIATAAGAVSYVEGVYDEDAKVFEIVGALNADRLDGFHASDFTRPSGVRVMVGTLAARPSTADRGHLYLATGASGRLAIWKDAPSFSAAGHAPVAVGTLAARPTTADRGQLYLATDAPGTLAAWKDAPSFSGAGDVPMMVGTLAARPATADQGQLYLKTNVPSRIAVWK